MGGLYECRTRSARLLLLDELVAHLAPQHLADQRARQLVDGSMRRGTL